MTLHTNFFITKINIALMESVASHSSSNYTKRISNHNKRRTLKRSSTSLYLMIKTSKSSLLRCLQSKQAKDLALQKYYSSPSGLINHKRISLICEITTATHLRKQIIINQEFAINSSIIKHERPSNRIIIL